MKGFSITLVLASIILSCGPKLSAADGVILYRTDEGDITVLPTNAGVCQNFSKGAHMVQNHTPGFTRVFVQLNCQGPQAVIYPRDVRVQPTGLIYSLMTV
ncbi:hypothetical protein BC943DRAFT_327022 [Umbelopsis sp. AD052]|nr:hypothetical protein BC943DRAFT_327022 [Umbelopsis sp. AD052]